VSTLNIFLSKGKRVSVGVGRLGTSDGPMKMQEYLKGLSHEIFRVNFWLEWIYLGLNENRYWFLNFKEDS
jgi:hypothetical protein